MKTCNVCNQEKQFENFSPFKQSKDGRSSVCKVCAATRTRQWQKDNPERYKLNQRRTNLAKHGLTPDMYDELVTKQNNQCATCFRTSDKNLHIDHDHNCCPGGYSCGKCIRGLLCGNCNTSLGLVRDDPEVLKNMLKYLGAVL